GRSRAGGRSRMTAAWMWAASELRGRWRSWVVLGLLAGGTFGLAAAGWAGARRTSAALPNYLATPPTLPDAGALVNDPTFDPAKQAQVAALPEVTRIYPFEVAVFLAAEPTSDGGGLVPESDATTKLLGSPLVQGRYTDPHRADEIVVDQNMQRHYGLT